MRWGFLVAAIAIALATELAWADVKTTASCEKTKATKRCQFDIHIDGEIGSATLDGLKRSLIDRDEMIRREGGDSDGWMIDIDSPGGDVRAAIEIGRLLRSVDAPIVIKPDQTCVSACVLILAGATHRIIWGRVGIHRPHFEAPSTDVGVGEVQKAYVNMTEQIRSYLRQMNMSDRLRRRLQGSRRKWANPSLRVRPCRSARGSNCKRVESR